MMIRRSKWPIASECDDDTYAIIAASPHNTTGTEKSLDTYGGMAQHNRHIAEGANSCFGSGLPQATAKLAR